MAPVHSSVMTNHKLSKKASESFGEDEEKKTTKLDSRLSIDTTPQGVHYLTF